MDEVIPNTDGGGGPFHRSGYDLTELHVYCYQSCDHVGK